MREAEHGGVGGGVGGLHSNVKHGTNTQKSTQTHALPLSTYHVAEMHVCSNGPVVYVHIWR